MVEGLLLGGVIGVALGTAVGLSQLVRGDDRPADADGPRAAAPRADPAVHPLVRHRRAAQGLLVALGVSFPLYLNTFSAIRQVDPKLFETAQVLGFSFWQRFRRSSCPSAAPQVLVGLRQSLAIAWLTLIVAEQINADKGIGFLINNARDFLRIDIIIFGLIVYALLGIGTDAIVRAAGASSTEVPRMTVTSVPTIVGSPITVAGELRNVDKWYGEHHVLEDVSVRIGTRRDRRAHRPQRLGQVDGAAGAGRVCRPTTPATARLPGPLPWLSRSPGCFRGATYARTWPTA